MSSRSANHRISTEQRIPSSQHLVQHFAVTGFQELAWKRVSKSKVKGPRT